MDWNRIEGNWKQVKGKVKEQWGKLTDDDLDVVAASRTSSRDACSNATAITKIRPRRKSTTGIRVKTGNENESPAETGLS